MPETGTFEATKNRPEIDVAKSAISYATTEYIDNNAKLANLKSVICRIQYTPMIHHIGIWRYSQNGKFLQTIEALLPYAAKGVEKANS